MKINPTSINLTKSIKLIMLNLAVFGIMASCGNPRSDNRGVSPGNIKNPKQTEQTTPPKQLNKAEQARADAIKQKADSLMGQASKILEIAKTKEIRVKLFEEEFDRFFYPDVNFPDSPYEKMLNAINDKSISDEQRNSLQVRYNGGESLVQNGLINWAAIEGMHQRRDLVPTGLLKAIDNFYKKLNDLQTKYSDIRDLQLQVEAIAEELTTLQKEFDEIVGHNGEFLDNNSLYHGKIPLTSWHADRTYFFTGFGYLIGSGDGTRE